LQAYNSQIPLGVFIEAAIFDSFFDLSDVLDERFLKAAELLKILLNRFILRFMVSNLGKVFYLI